jgi:hypothetical protein
MTFYDLNMNSKRITSCQDPSGNQDVATKNYVDTTSGIVRQVIFASTNTTLTTNSATPVTTGLTATITPSSASNKVVILCMLNLGKTTNNAFANPQAVLFRGTVAGTAINATLTNVGNDSGAGMTTTVPINWVDSPNTTSPQIYTVGFNIASNLETAVVQRNGAGSTMILMEIEN